MNSTTIAHIGTVKTLLASLVANIGNMIDGTAGGVEAKLAAAERIELDMAVAEQNIAGLIHAARQVAGTRAQSLRAELNQSALARVVAMLQDGTLNIEQLAAQSGVAAPAAAIETPAAPVAPIVAQAPVDAPVAAAALPTAPIATAETAETAETAATAAKLPSAIRTNLALQAGYLNAMKYRDPATGAGWTGRGPTPKWLKELCVDGVTKDDFLVKSEVVAIESAAAAPAPTEQQSQAASEESPSTVVVEPAVEASAPADTDIGEEVVGSFDASGFDSDLDAPALSGVDDDDDIGEIVQGIAAMGPLDNATMARFAAAV